MIPERVETLDVAESGEGAVGRCITPGYRVHLEKKGERTEVVGG